LNQYITQRTLAARTLKQGQLGVIFAAFLKLLIPFIIIFPGIMAFQLYKDQLTATADAAYPLLIKNLVTTGLRGFIFAAISGAVVSSLASMLNSASTIFTMDLYKRHWNQKASERSLIKMGRITTAIFVLIGCFIAPQLANPKFKGIFNYIQEFQGFLSPGVLAAFIFGLFVHRAPASAGVAALVLCPILYGFLLIFFPEVAFLNRIAITFIAIIAVMTALTLAKPLSAPVKLPVRQEFDMRPAPAVVWLGTTVIVLTLALYVIFW
jgi:SSS family solute:Na+ symporter